MIKNRSEIKSSQITDAVCYLCKKAACFLPEDVYNGLKDVYSRETSETARKFLEEILINTHIAARTRRPICQDTGIVAVFIEIGQSIIINGDSIETAVNKGVEKAYKEFSLRNSIVNDPVFDRTNTGTNTPAVVHVQIVPGNSLKITVVPKGSGSENMSAVKMLKPSEGIEGIINFVVETVKNAGANSCPPIQIGVGIGGTMEYAGLLAKKALLNPIIPISELERSATNNEKNALELKILNEIQKTGVGAIGFGGKYTAFAVSVETYPCHMASLPVAVNLNCHAARHASMIIEENTTVPDKLEPDFEILALSNTIDSSSYKKITLPLKNKDIEDLKAGDKVLLTGTIYTARDAAHKKFENILKTDKQLPFDIKGQTIYYAGPCPAKKDETIGPAGPTTSERMDVYTPQLLEQGLKATIGKGRRSAEVVDSIRKNKAVYFVATGGAACLLSEKIVSAEVIAYPELGAEAVYRLDVKDFPVIVAIDSNGNIFYETGQ